MGERRLAGWSGVSDLFGTGVPLWRFNRLPAGEAAGILRTCLDVERWVSTIVAARPHRRLDDLFEAAREAAFPFTPAELEAALATIVIPPVVPPPWPGETRRQAQVREQLAVGVRQYQRRFGRLFVIRKDGRNDAQVLVHLWTRLGHDIDTEDRAIAQQVREIALAALARTITD